MTLASTQENLNDGILDNIPGISVAGIYPFQVFVIVFPSPPFIAENTFGREIFADPAECPGTDA